MAIRQELARHGERCLMAVGLHGVPMSSRGRVTEGADCFLDNVKIPSSGSGWYTYRCSAVLYPKSHLGPKTHRLYGEGICERHSEP